MAPRRPSGRRSRPGCAPRCPRFQSYSRSAWWGWWRLVRHSGKRLHPPWKTERKHKIITAFSNIDIPNMKHVFIRLCDVCPRSCSFSGQAGTVPADFTYRDSLLLGGDKWSLVMKTFIHRGSWRYTKLIWLWGMFTYSRPETTQTYFEFLRRTRHLLTAADCSHCSPQNN